MSSLAVNSILLISLMSEQVWYFISKNQLDLQCSNPLRSSPGRPPFSVG